MTPERTELGTSAVDDILMTARTAARTALAAVLGRLGSSDSEELLDALGELIESYDADRPNAIDDIAGKLIDAVLDERPSAGDAECVAPSSTAGLTRLELVVETDDEGEIEWLSDAITQLACPLDHSRPGVEEPCRVPWFLTVVHLDDDDETTSELRSLLNR